MTGSGYLNQVSHSYTYSILNRLTNLSVNRIETDDSLSALQSYAYTLNKSGHRTRIDELNGRRIDNVFDKLYRLKSESTVAGTSGPEAPIGTVSYTYDAVGNRTARTVAQASSLLAQLLPDQSPTYTDNDWLTTDTYDSNGNTTQSSSTLSTDPLAPQVSDLYDFRNKLIQRTNTDGTVIDCYYDTDGNRTKKTVTPISSPQLPITTTYLVDRNNHTGYAQVLEEKDNIGALTTLYTYGHDLLRRAGFQPASEPEQSYYSYDGLGSVRALSDEDGAIIEEYDYDAYGTLIAFRQLDASTASMNSLPPATFALNSSNRYLFAGEQYDSDLGMYYLRARYLNTHSGRFHSMDTYEGRTGEPQTLHKYLYAHNNPVSNIDPSGKISIGGLIQSIQTQVSIAGQALVRITPQAVRTADKALKIIVSSYVRLNYLVALSNPKLSFSALVSIPYAEKRIKKFKRQVSIGVGRARRIKRLLGFIARAGAKATIAQEFGLSLSPNGFPDFSNFIHPIRGVVYIQLSGNGSTDKTRAKIARGGLPNPKNYVWHHHEAMGVMMLVRRDVHTKVGLGHRGGVFFWEITGNKQYKR